MKSENAEKNLGIHYYLFASSDGEIMSGGGTLPRDAFIDEIMESATRAIKGLTDENPHRHIVITLDTEPDERKDWTTYKYG